MRRQKIIIILVGLIFSTIGYTQNTDFTEKENLYVENLINDLQNAETNMQIISMTENALRELPYHPKLVLMYLIALKTEGTNKSIETAMSYCEKFDDIYLNTNSSILEFCSLISFLNQENKNFLKDKKSLHNNQITKDIIESIIAYIGNDTNKFVSIAVPLIEKEYKGIYPLRQIVLSGLVEYYYSTNNFDDLELIYKNHFKHSQQEVADLRTIVIFSEFLNDKKEFNGLLGIIKNTQEMYPELENWLGIFKARPFAELGNYYSAEEALLNSLKLKENEINKLITGLQINYFEYFLNAVLKIEDKDLQIKLTEALHQKKEYRNNANLLLANFYAEQNISKSLEYLTTYGKNKNTFITSENIDDFGEYEDEVFLVLLADIFKLNFELTKKKRDKDYKKIDKYLSELHKITDADFLVLKKFKNQLKANTASQEEIFDFKKIKTAIQNISKEDFPDIYEDKSLNEMLELLKITSTYFTDREKAFKVLNQCKYCENYDTEFLGEAMEEGNDVLVTFFLDKLETLEEDYEEFKLFFLAKAFGL